ncbi:MAG: GGDEF domain-containing protein [Treponema sp.]|nr:GGDEF domain-containing protein [Treponema sp.]
MKKQINPTTARFFSTFCVSALILMIVFLLTSTVMERSLRLAEKRYVESCSEVLEGYANAIHFYLENYHTSLSSIYDENLFKEGDTKKIQEWLADNKKYIHPDFCTTFYISANRVGYFSNGAVIDLADRSYVTAASFGEENYYVSDIMESIYSPTPIFVIEEGVFDNFQNLIGVLCASIKINALEKIAKDIKIGNASYASIMDRQGKYLFHPYEENIAKTYTPNSEEYRFFSSDMIAQSADRIVETENSRGEKIDLFTAKIENCGWTLGVAFPKTRIEQIHRQQHSTKLFILLTSAVSLFALLLLELLVSDYFYRNQFIAAVYDPLTTLWTREHFEKKATRIFKRFPKTKFMLIEADIRGFKFINQNYGEVAADSMIRYYSTILNSAARDLRGIIGRGYADHFYMLIKIRDVRTAMRNFKNLSESISSIIKSYEIPFFPKFGITFFRPEQHKDVTVKELIGQASFAKSTIKDNMVVPYAIYNTRLLGRVNEEHYIETSMENALKTGEFFIMYQPKIKLSTEAIVGAEALVRWRTKDRGILAPDKFIPLFERNGFITKLDFYVYDQVFRFLDKQLKAKKPIVPISVNMSRNHNKPERFMQDFMDLFHRYDIPPNLVQVEILERSVMDNETLCEITERLHDKGFTVAMDDFGSGESSLNMLTKVPVDVLKFDRDFLRSSTAKNGSMDEKSAKFIQSLIDLSKHLEKETVFEGVETAAQRDFLRDAACDQVQGYFYSCPLMESDFVSFMEKHMKIGE